MQYLMLSYGTPADWDAGPDQRVLIGSGEFVYAARPADPAHLQTVEMRAGVPVVTAGPHARADDVLAGFGIVEVASHDRALEIAAQLSGGLGVLRRIEVRPILADGDSES